MTGGAGSIGAYVAQALLERGDEVGVIDNFNNFYDPELKRARVEKFLSKSTPIFEIDITNGDSLDKVFAEFMPQRVIHLAAWASVTLSVKHPLLFTRENVCGTVQVFESAVRHKIEHVVFASSSSVYNKDTPPPFSESAACEISLASYGTSKRAGELYARMYQELYGISITALRFFTVYGPWVRPDMAMWKIADRISDGMPVILRSKTKSGEEVKRDFTYIDDIVKGVVSALDHPEGFALYNLGRDDPANLFRFVAAIEEGLGRKAIIQEEELLPEEMVITSADITAAKEKLGFTPTVSLEEGAKQFTQWYNGEFREKFPRGLAETPYSTT